MYIPRRFWTFSQLVLIIISNKGYRVNLEKNIAFFRLLLTDVQLSGYKSLGSEFNPKSSPLSNADDVEDYLNLS